MNTSLILIVCAGVIISVLWYGFRKMCSSCHTLFSLKKVGEEHHRSETRYRTETHKDVEKDRSGNIIKTIEKKVQVPYEVHFYNVTYRCSKCGYQFQRVERSGKHLKEAGGLFLIVVLVIGGIVGKENKKNQQDETQTTPVQQEQVEQSNTEPKQNVYNTDQNSEKSINTDTVGARSVQDVSTDNNIKEPAISTNQVTRESSQMLKIQLAKEMIGRGKSEDEIADSTYLPRNKIKSLMQSVGN
ncbi:MAG: hypothetical protein WCL70_12365 [Paludibacter sp.]